MSQPLTGMMGAMTTTLFAMLSRGTHVVVTDDSYRRTRQFLNQTLSRYGIEVSTVPAGVATEALGYLREGGPENLRELARFLSDAVMLTGEGFDPPAAMPLWGTLERPASTATARSE